MGRHNLNQILLELYLLSDLCLYENDTKIPSLLPPSLSSSYYKTYATRTTITSSPKLNETTVTNSTATISASNNVNTTAAAITMMLQLAVCPTCWTQWMIDVSSCWACWTSALHSTQSTKKFCCVDFRGN